MGVPSTGILGGGGAKSSPAATAAIANTDTLRDANAGITVAHRGLVPYPGSLPAGIGFVEKRLYPIGGYVTAGTAAAFLAPDMNSAALPAMQDGEVWSVAVEVFCMIENGLGVWRFTSAAMMVLKVKGNPPTFSAVSPSPTSQVSLGESGIAISTFTVGMDSTTNQPTLKVIATNFLVNTIWYGTIEITKLRGNLTYPNILMQAPFTASSTALTQTSQSLTLATSSPTGGTLPAGTFSVSGGILTFTSPGSTSTNLQFQLSTMYNYSVEAVFAPSASLVSGMGLFMRAGNNNLTTAHYRVIYNGSQYILQFYNGTNTLSTVGTSATTPTAGDVIRLIANETAISVTRNGTQIITYTDTASTNNTNFPISGTLGGGNGATYGPLRFYLG